MDLDVESMLKSFSYCSISVSRTALLREFSKFLKGDKCNISHHVAARGLLSVDRILKYWELLTSYFQSLLMFMRLTVLFYSQRCCGSIY